MEDLEKLIEELQLEQDKIRPIEKGQWLIAYRKYLWALKFIEEKIYRPADYSEYVTISTIHIR